MTFLAEHDLIELQQKFAQNFLRHGVSPAALEWGRGGRQEYRFAALCGDIIADPDSSVLDIGCGFADLYIFLRRRGWRGAYHGLDLTREFVEHAKSLYGHDSSFEVTLGEFSRLVAENNGLSQSRYDHVVFIGMHYLKLARTDPWIFLRHNLQRAMALCRKSVVADFMSTYVDFQHPSAFHAAPEQVFSFAKSLTRRVALRHDYLPYEFCVKLYKNEMITQPHAFLTENQGDEHNAL